MRERARSAHASGWRQWHDTCRRPHEAAARKCALNVEIRCLPRMHARRAEKRWICPELAPSGTRLAVRSGTVGPSPLVHLLRGA
eukprot:6185858-Pleurochrysis_carterae.AAC.3